MEASALQPVVSTPRIRSPLLRLHTDERLIALLRRGNESAFEVLVTRYQSRLQNFCRQLLASPQDAEDVVQEVFVAAFNALLRDNRKVIFKPWLYRIARNRSLNHLRRVQPIATDTLDTHLSENGQTTAEVVHKRDDLRLLLGDVRELPETQRTALVLRQMESLSYDQIAQVMDTTVSAVKSLLVRARMTLAESSQARLLSCSDVRATLGAVAEGLTRLESPVRRHLRACDDCAQLRKHLKQTNKALAALFPVAPLALLQHGLATPFIAAKQLIFGSGLAASSTGAASTVLPAGITVKAAAGIATAAVVAAGAVEVKHNTTVRKPDRSRTVHSQRSPHDHAQLAQNSRSPRTSPPLIVAQNHPDSLKLTPVAALTPPAAPLNESPTVALTQPSSAENQAVKDPMATGTKTANQSDNLSTQTVDLRRTGATGATASEVTTRIQKADTPVRVQNGAVVAPVDVARSQSSKPAAPTPAQIKTQAQIGAQNTERNLDQKSVSTHLSSGGTVAPETEPMSASAE